MDLIESDLDLVNGSRFDPDRTGLGPNEFKVRTPDREFTIEVRRDWGGAVDENVDFITHSIEDLRALVACLQGSDVLSPQARESISERIRRASPAPWRAYLESHGQGGPDFIQTGETDAETDMYLWVGSSLAPSQYFAFVAAARTHIPRLLSELQLHE